MKLKIEIKYIKMIIFLSIIYHWIIKLINNTLTSLGDFWRKYISMQQSSKHSFRWLQIESLHKKGNLKNSFGYPIYDKMPMILSKIENNNLLASRYKK